MSTRRRYLTCTSAVVLAMLIPTRSTATLSSKAGKLAPTCAAETKYRQTRFFMMCDPSAPASDAYYEQRPSRAAIFPCEPTEWSSHKRRFIS